MSNATYVKIDETRELHIEPVGENQVEVAVQTDGTTRPPTETVYAMLRELFLLAEDYAEEDEDPSALAERFADNLQNEELVVSTFAKVERANA